MKSTRHIQGINWAQSEKPVTHGIWIWDKPFILSKPDGSKVSKCYFFALTCKLELSTTSSLNYTNRIFSKVSTAIMCTFLILSCYNTSAVIICVTVLIWWQVALLLVDTQGTGDNTRSEKLNGLIMFISLQLSSTQMLNVWKYLRVDELSSLKVS